MSSRPSLRSSISAAERARREREVDFPRGNVRHEGGILPDEIERATARHLAGELGSGELRVTILASKVVELGFLPRSGSEDRRVGRRVPCPTNVGNALSSTISIVTTGRRRRQGCAVPPILPRPSLRFDHDKIGTPTPRRCGRFAVL